MSQIPQRAIVIGFRRWRAWNLAPVLRAQAGQVIHVRDVAGAARLHPGPDDALMVWGAADPAGLAALVAASGATLVRIEDGFVRSVGLGSDLIPPRSLVFDSQGIYFDATRASGLETLLLQAPFAPGLRARAAALRQMIVARRLTKYNIEDHTPPEWNTGGRPVVLVPGQVETDASIALGGAGAIRTNAELLRAVRAECGDAFLVYKPHPDVMSGNRRGRMARHAALALADHVETRASIVACLAQASQLHTITSLAGFDALLRDVPVVTYGAPFYAGWGLTRDRATGHPALARRAGTTLDRDDLVAAALLLYPRYWEPETQRFVRAEQAIGTVADMRDRLTAQGRLGALRDGFVARQWRKTRVIARAWMPHPLSR